MYKTVRHGENSLQYTILPQNDDFRIEGKLSGVGNSCSGRADSRQLKTNRPKRKSFFAYLGLIFVCTVIVGAVLIPFLVSTECLPSPTEWFLKTKAAFIKSGLSKKNSTNPISSPNVIRKNDQIDPKDYSASIGKTVKIVNQNNVEMFTLKTNNASVKDINPGKFSNVENAISASIEMNIDKDKEHNDIKLTNIDSDNIKNSNTFITEVRFDTPSSNNAVLGPAIMVTTVQSSIGNNNNDEHPSNNLNPTAHPTSKYNPPTINLSPESSNGSQIQNNSISAIPTIVTRIMQVPLIKATAKKVTPPSIIKENFQHNENSELKVQNIQITEAESNAINDLPKTIPITTNTEKTKNSVWMQSHWPYIDPSTYFQWTGYKAEDSVLLPALLGFALIGIILVVTVCLIARNKRTIVSSVRKRNRNDIEAIGSDDNATLLATAGLSDED